MWMANYSSVSLLAGYLDSTRLFILVKVHVKLLIFSGRIYLLIIW